MYESVQLKNVPEGKHHDLYDRNDTSREEVWGWLEAVRISGDHNMFGVRPMLMEEFLLVKKDATEMLEDYDQYKKDNPDA